MSRLSEGSHLQQANQHRPHIQSHFVSTGASNTVLPPSVVPDPSSLAPRMYIAGKQVTGEEGEQSYREEEE